jgi:hypothetical protein
VFLCIQTGNEALNRPDSNSHANEATFQCAALQESRVQSGIAKLENKFLLRVHYSRFGWRDEECFVVKQVPRGDTAAVNIGY